MVFTRLAAGPSLNVVTFVLLTLLQQEQLSSSSYVLSCALKNILILPITSTSLTKGFMTPNA